MTELKDEKAIATTGDIISIDQRGIVPKTSGELVRMAKLVHESGLSPSSFRTWQQVTVAMGMCLELGRPILTGIQDMAVINGRVGIYGDAALALVRASGLLEIFEEWEKGQAYKDDWVCYCKLKRKGCKERTAEWSWLDAKRAGFDDPKTKDGRKDIWSPWTRFTRRMMQFKARNFPLRDEFGDILKGIRTTEELQDVVELQQAPNGTYKTPESEADLQEALKNAPEGAAQNLYGSKTSPDKQEPATDADEPGKQGVDTDTTKTDGIDPAIAQAFSEFTDGGDAGVFWRIREKGLNEFFDTFEGVMASWPQQLQDFIYAKCKNISGKHPEFVARLNKALEDKPSLPDEGQTPSPDTQYTVCPDGGPYAGKRVSYAAVCGACAKGPGCQEYQAYLHVQKENTQNILS